MQSIGLLFGSFNPIHIGHLALANYMLATQNLSEVWLVVSPHNPFKEQNTLIDSSHRLNMLQIALANQANYKACDIELNLPTPSYTINTLEALTQLHPQKKFSIIMGADNISKLTLWKSAEKILANYPILVYPRPNCENTLVKGANITFTEAPLINISSTYIRQMISEGIDMRFFMPMGVGQYITENNLYKKLSI